MSNIYLEPAELSYLLQTVNARSVIGIDSAELFPQDEAENEVLLRTGSKRLQANGWLVADAQSGKMQFNETLCYLVAIMADPEFAIMTVQQQLMGSFQLITHYLAGQLIVEQIRTADKRYQLAFVSRLSTTLERIQSVIRPVTDAGQNQIQIMVERQSYARMKELVRRGQTESAVSEFEKHGFDHSHAASLVSTMQLPELRTAVAVLQREDGQATTTCNLTVMQGQQDGWLLRSEGLDAPDLILEAYWPQRFNTYLASCLHRTVTGLLN
jgi:hypothetical protein